MKDRKSHYVWNNFVLLVDLSVCAFLLFIYVFLFLFCYSSTHGLSYARGYEIRQCNDISHCDCFRF